VPGRLDLSRRLVWTDTNAHAVLKASLHGSHEAPFTSTPLHPNGNAISTSSPSSYSTTTSTAYAATQAARSAWNTANAPAMNQAQSYVEQQQQAAGGSRQQYQGALLWPVAVRGVGGARQHSSSSSGSSGSNIDEERSSSDGDGASATPSVLPNGVVVAEYLGRVWLLRDDGKYTHTCTCITAWLVWVRALLNVQMVIVLTSHCQFPFVRAHTHQFPLNSFYS